MGHAGSYNPQARSMYPIIQSAALIALAALGSGCDDKKIERVTYDKPPPADARRFAVPEGKLDAEADGHARIAAPQTITGGEPLLFEGLIELGSISAPPSVACLSMTQPGPNGKLITQQSATKLTEAMGGGRVKYMLQANAPKAPGRYHVEISYLVAVTPGETTCENRVVAEGDIEIVAP